jgi:hypothetical protein
VVSEMNIKEYFSIHPSERYQNYLEHISKASHKSGTYISDGMLRFDAESACIWGGPFPGNFAYYVFTDERDNKHIFNEELQVKNFFDNLNKHSKRKIGVGHDEYEVTLCHAINEYPTIEKPFRLYMAGNDDASYSKNFSSKEEGLEFIALCESCQPLNAFRDIQQYFAFTN